MASRFNLGPAGETSRGVDDAHAQPLEALDAVVGSDGRDDALHMVVHPLEVHVGFPRVDAEGCAATLGVGGVRRRDQRL